MTELVPLAKEKGIKRVIIKKLQLSQVNLLFVPFPFKSVKQNIHSATMFGSQHKRAKCKIYDTIVDKYSWGDDSVKRLLKPPLISFPFS